MTADGTLAGDAIRKVNTSSGRITDVIGVGGVRGPYGRVVMQHDQGTPDVTPDGKRVAYTTGDANPQLDVVAPPGPDSAAAPSTPATTSRTAPTGSPSTDRRTPSPAFAGQRCRSRPETLNR